MSNLLNFIHSNHASISAGFLSGSLHAVTGPDHFMAILPLVVTLRWYNSGLYGGCWGLGHGICSMILGFFAFHMKAFFFQSSTLTFLIDMRFFSDLMIGTTLCVIGFLGMIEGFDDDTSAPTAEPSSPSHTTGFSDDIESNKHTKAAKSDPVHRAIVAASLVVNGFVMGLSWDGLPSLAPTMLLSTPAQIYSFLVSYLLSTAAIMCAVSSLIGESSYWLMSRHRERDFSTRFSALTSFIALCIGGIWIALGLFKACHYLLSTSSASSSPMNDGVASLSAHPSSSEFLLNLVVSTVSMGLMIAGIVIGIFYPGLHFEKTVFSLSRRCHRIYEHYSSLCCHLMKTKIDND